MAADDKESDERRQSRSFERDRGKHRRWHRSDSPSPPKQRRKRSRSAGSEGKHRHKNSAEKYEVRKGPELSNQNTEGMSEEDNGREVARQIGVEDDEKAGSRKSSKEDRKVESHSSGDSSEDAYSDSKSDKGMKKKSRSRNQKSRKSKGKHHRHVCSESEKDESQPEGTSGESSEDSEDGYRRAKRRKQLKQKKKAERERKEERRRKKEKAKCCTSNNSVSCDCVLKKRKMKEKEREHENRKKKKEKVEKRAKGPVTDDVGDFLERDNMDGNEGSNSDPVLDPKHKIFLSHSGAQKEFVDHLCQALENRCHYPFFDRRHESLPKGERFAELIVRAAQQCEMLIVVVSDEYFMSKWPMIELSAFVEAHKLHHGFKIGPKILPLFYGLSVSDLDDEGMRKKWFQEWETLAEADSKEQIVVNDWKIALDVLRTFNGLLYDRSLKEVVAYEEQIVSFVCKTISPDIKWDDSHVQGKSRICKVIGEKIERIGVSQKYQVKVLSIHGVGGIGKTTTCMTMCIELLSKYEGRVCHIEFPSDSSFDSKELFQKVVRDLTKKTVEVKERNEGECQDILRKSLLKHKTFLAIDNVSDNMQSIFVDKKFLEFPYHMESLVVVTARSRSVLGLLGLDGDACIEMPEFGEDDAVNLFLQYATNGKEFVEVEEKQDIMTCVKRCNFFKGGGQGGHYHPLALRALGLRMSFYGGSPCDWVKKLPQVKGFKYFSNENHVFDILRGSFDMLSRNDQALFMDVGFFGTPKFLKSYSTIDWLCCLQKREELVLWLEHLKQKGLVQSVDWKYGRISMHDLYLEFAKLEASSFFDETTSLRKRMWMYIENGDLGELGSRPKSGSWDKLIRLAIGQPNIFVAMQESFGEIEGLEGLKWDYFSNVEVLQLYGFHWCHGVWNLEGLMRLRILELKDIGGIDGVEGLEKLKHLTIFDWKCWAMKDNTSRRVHIVGQFPSSLKRLYIWHVYAVLRSDVLARCINLSHLVLGYVEVRSLDLRNCLSLESVHLFGISKMQTLSIGADGPPLCLQDLCIDWSEDLVTVLGVHNLLDLKRLCIGNSPKWEVPSLLALTKLQVLRIKHQYTLAAPPKHYCCGLLQKLNSLVRKFGKGLNLTRFNQLEVLDLSRNDGLTSLAEMGDLPALQHFDLRGCKYLLRMPNLSMSRNLKELELNGCLALELHETDIQMFLELPLLQPFPFSGDIWSNNVRLDFARGKMLVHSSKYHAPYDWELWKANEWEERDLGAPPFKIGKHGT